jgi:uncharacterized membrane protein YhaH (DUF805 family)
MGIGPYGRSYPPVPPRTGSWLRREFSAHGRVNRITYFLNGLICFGFYMVAIGVFIGGGFSVARDNATGIAGGIILLVAGIAGFFTVMAVGIITTIKRLHDVGQSGWLCLVTLIPYVGPLFGLALLVWPGNDYPNQHGDVPLQGYRI